MCQNDIACRPGYIPNTNKSHIVNVSEENVVGLSSSLMHVFTKLIYYSGLCSAHFERLGSFILINTILLVGLIDNKKYVRM